jgi:hypothetical protein
MAITDRINVMEGFETCGCSVTALTVKGVTPTVLTNMGTTELAKAKLIAEAQFARTVGLTIDSWHELLISRVTEIGKGALREVKIKGSQSLVLPYYYRRRRANISDNYFTIVGSTATPGAGSNGIHPGSRDLTIGLPDSKYITRELPNISRYFLPGTYIYVSHADDGAPGANVSYKVMFKITASEPAANAADGSSQALVTVEPNYTATAWGGLSSGEKEPFEPSSGLVEVGVNNINDREAWCHNLPSNNNGSLVVDWVQTFRWSTCHNDEFDRIATALAKGEVNVFQANWGQAQEIANINKQQLAKNNQNFYNAVWYNDVINEAQNDPDQYEQLPKVVDPDPLDSSCEYAYKANALGVHTQLRRAAQVFDLLGGDLSLDFLIQVANDLKEVRAVDSGGDTSVVDIFTDEFSGRMLGLALRGYIRQLYGFREIRTFEEGSVNDETGHPKFRFTKYYIPGFNLTLAIFVSNFFTRRLDILPAGLKNTGRALYLIDWSDISVGVVETNSASYNYKDRDFGNYNALYSCVIAPNTKRIKLWSKTFSVELGDPKRSAVIENFNGNCPTWTPVPCALGYTPEPVEEEEE